VQIIQKIQLEASPSPMEAMDSNVGTKDFRNSDNVASQDDVACNDLQRMDMLAGVREEVIQETPNFELKQCQRTNPLKVLAKALKPR